MKHPPNRGIGQDHRRRDRLIEERVHDPYATRKKLRDPAGCPDCGAVYRGDRWTWTPSGENEAPVEERCPACRRIADGYPAGEVLLTGGFLAGHAEEIVNLLRNTEALENGEHPLHRIMAIEEGPGRLVVTTTDIHLPRRLGQALLDAWQGALDVRYDDAGHFVRVTWQRG